MTDRFTTPSATSATDPVDATVDRARLLLDLGRAAEAEPLLRQALVADPQHYAALTHLAWLLHIEDRSEEAEQAAEVLIKHYPEDSEGYRRMAWVLRDTGRPAAAEPFARRAARLDPDDPATLRALAAVLWGLPGHEAESLAASNRAVELAPEESANFAIEAVALATMHRWTEAAEAAHAALALDPTDSSLLAQCGLLNLRLGKGDEARTQFQLALRLSPTPDVARNVLEKVETHGVPETLLDMYRTLCAACGIPDLTVPGAAWADPHLQNRQVELAERMYSSATYNHPWSKSSRDRVEPILAAILDVAPGHVGARRLAVRVADELDRPDEALGLAMGLLADGVESGGAGVEIYGYAVNALRALDRGVEAVALADAAVTAFPLSAEAYGLRAQALSESGDGEAAVEAARRAVELDPREPGHHCVLARVLEDLGDELEYKEAAKQAYLTALALDPHDPQARFGLGSLRMLAFQDYPRAEEEYLRITLPDPSGERTACLAHVRFLQGKWDAALAGFEAAMAMPMRSARAVELVVGALEYFGAPGVFREVYVRALAAQGKVDVAGEEGRRLLAGVPLVEGERLAALGFLMVVHGADDKAEELADLALEVGPETEAARALKDALDGRGDVEVAEAIEGLRYRAVGD